MQLNSFWFFGARGKPGDEAAEEGGGGRGREEMVDEEEFGFGFGLEGEELCLGEEKERDGTQMMRCVVED